MVKAESQYDPRTPGCPRAGSLGALLRTGFRFSNAIETALRAKGFPPLHWLDVLVELDAAADGRLTQTEIESRTAISQHNLSRQLDRMQAEGLVQRVTCPNDRRANHIVLTPEGKAMRTAMGKAFTSTVAELVGPRLSIADARRLKALLATLADGA